MTEILLVATVKNGSLHFLQERLIRDQLSGLEGRTIILTGMPVDDQRSLAQNRAYHSLKVKVLADRMGTDKYTMHEYLKRRLNPVEITLFNVDTGEIVDQDVVGGSTKTMSKKKFADFNESINQFAAESLGVVLADPGQTEFLEENT